MNCWFQSSDIIKNNEEQSNKNDAQSVTPNKMGQGCLIE